MRNNIFYAMKRFKKHSSLTMMLLLLLINILAIRFSIRPSMAYQGETVPQGFSPVWIVITADGQYAYVCFDLSEVVFKMDLENFTVKAVADLSDYFPLESKLISLDQNEEKIFVHSKSWSKLLVLDTQTMEIIHVIDDIGMAGLIRSLYGPYLIACDGGQTVRYINTETYEVTEFTDTQMYFERIQESKYNQNIWYVANGTGSDFYAGIYNHSAKES